MSAVSTLSVCESIRAAFPFEVAKLPLSGPDNARTPHYGLFRNDTGNCVGSAVRAQYQPHTVDDICALAESATAAFAGETVVTARWFRDSHSVIVAPSRDYRQSIFGTDTIWPRMIVNAGYDGTCFVGSLGYYRDLCKNMAIIRAAGAQTSMRIKHTAQLRDKLTELNSAFRQLASGWENVVDEARRMQAQQTDLADFLRQVYPLPAETTARVRRSAEDRISTIVRRIMSERQQTGYQSAIGRATVWEAFNGVQGFVQHNVRRRGNVDQLDRALMALDDSAVERAHNLAISLAS